MSDPQLSYFQDEDILHLSLSENPSMPTEPILIVNFFRANSGREPVRDWLKGMDREDRKRIGEDIKLVQFRWPLGMPLVRKMEADLWEVWTNLGEGNIARVFFTVRGTRMVLLHGLKKKSQKTPRQELELTGACVQESMAQ